MAKSGSGLNNAVRAHPSPVGPLPSVPFDVDPTDEEVAFFRENGFLAVERITSDAEIEWLTSLYEHIFDPAQATAPGGPIDRSGVRDAAVAGKLTQVFHPELRFPDILRTNYVRNAKRYAEALVGADMSELTSWTHMIRKAPGGRAAYWHQDEAFWPPNFDYCALNAWLPMHDVSIEMGAMQFIPGSHRQGVLRHRHEDEPAQNVLTADEPFDVANAVACPLRKGACTFHHPATLHYTAVNQTDRPRLAFPLTVQGPPIRRAAPRVMPWLDAFVAANGGRPQTSYIADGKVMLLPS